MYFTTSSRALCVHQRRIISVHSPVSRLYTRWRNVLITRSGKLGKRKEKWKGKEAWGEEALAFSGALRTLNSRF